MKMMSFTMVNVIVDNESHTMNVKRVNGVPVNVEQLFLILPEMIPSTIAGPQGKAVGKIATKLVSGGGAAITVEGTPKQVIKQIKDTFGIDIAVAPDLEKPDEPEKTDDGGPKTIKLIVPGRVEKEANDTPTEE